MTTALMDAERDCAEMLEKQLVKDDWLIARTEMATFEHTIRLKMIKPGNCNDM